MAPHRQVNNGLRGARQTRQPSARPPQRRDATEGRERPSWGEGRLLMPVLGYAQGLVGTWASVTPLNAAKA